MDESAEEPIRQQLRVVSVLDFTPGRAQDPEIGPPIGILTAGSKGEIEQPMMFTLADVKRMAVHGLSILATFGDETAEEIILKYYDAK